MADAFDHCETLVREGDKDRFLATLFAPQKYRRALYALYGFNLEVARIRDSAHQAMPGEVRLQWWRDVLGGAGRGDVTANPVAAALRDTVVRYRLPPAKLADLIDARTFDLYDDPMESLEALELYASHTSSALIEMAGRILSDGRDPNFGELSKHAGIAYAMTGILRALPLHAARGQCFVPADLLQRHGAKPEDLCSETAPVPLRAALAELRLRARQHLKAARDLSRGVSPELMPALLPVALVSRLLKRMERRRYDPLRSPDMPQWRRQWILWRAARRKNVLR